MPILEGGETEESANRIHFSTTTLDWTPAEKNSSFVIFPISTFCFSFLAMNQQIERLWTHCSS